MVCVIHSLDTSDSVHHRPSRHIWQGASSTVSTHQTRCVIDSIDKSDKVRHRPSRHIDLTGCVIDRKFPTYWKIMQSIWRNVHNLLEFRGAWDWLFPSLSNKNILSTILWTFVILLRLKTLRFKQFIDIEHLKSFMIYIRPINFILLLLVYSALLFSFNIIFILLDFIATKFPELAIFNLLCESQRLHSKGRHWR